MQTIKKNCPVCDKEFEAHIYTKYTQKFCSVECSVKNIKKVGEERRAKSHITKICPICNKEFSTLKHGFLTQKYCSRECSRKGNRPVGVWSFKQK